MIKLERLDDLEVRDLPTHRWAEVEVRGVGLLCLVVGEILKAIDASGVCLELVKKGGEWYVEKAIGVDVRKLVTLIYGEGAL